MARSTTFYLYKNVNLSPSTGDTFYFANRNAQNTFFASKLYDTISACSYQRENRNYIKINREIKYCYDLDYLCFLNANYENKRFYAFITEVNYISDNCTEIGYSIDVIQTWLLDCSIQPCFIERQHSTTDDIGDNILEESLELGDYLVDSMTDGLSTQSGRLLDYLVIIQGTFDIIGWVNSNFTQKPITGTVVRNGLYDAMSVCAVYASVAGQNNADSTSALGVILEKIFTGSGGVTIDDIQNMYIYPKVAIGIGNQTAVPGVTSQVTLYQSVWEVSSVATAGGYLGAYSQLPSRPSSLNGYTPKNNKLFTYPYCLLHITNNNGSAIDLKYERFADPDHPEATIFGTTTAEAKVRLVPREYFGYGNYDSVDVSYGIDSAPFPTVSLVGDSYNIWLAQNRNTYDNSYNDYKYKLLSRIGNTAVNSVMKIEQGGALQMGVLAMNEAVNARNETNRMLAEAADRQVAPNTAAGIQSEGLAFQNGKTPFTFITKTIDAYHAKMIDDFFTMYGYPVKQIGTPNLHVRTAFTYIKTIGCVLHGAAPEKDKQTIASMLDNGLRFWSNQNSIGNYTVTNNILT